VLKIISECYELVKLCHINRSGSVVSRRRINILCFGYKNYPYKWRIQKVRIGGLLLPLLFILLYLYPSTNVTFMSEVKSEYRNL